MSVGGGHVNLTDDPVSPPDPLGPDYGPADEDTARAYGEACAQLTLEAQRVARYLLANGVTAGAIRTLIAGLGAGGVDRAIRELARGIGT